MWQTGRQSSVTEKVIFRETEDKYLSKCGASSRRCVSARQRIGNYLPKLLETQQNAYKENKTSGPKGSLGNNLQSSVVVKHLTKAERADVPEQGAIGQRASTKRRALFSNRDLLQDINYNNILSLINYKLIVLLVKRLW